MKTIKVEKNKFTLVDEIEEVLEGKVKEIGSGAMVLVPKRYRGKEVYILVKK